MWPAMSNRENNYLELALTLIKSIVAHTSIFIQKHTTVAAINTQSYIGKLEALINSFNGRFQDFEQCRQKKMQAFADPFALPMNQVSPDYQLELIDLQSPDAMRAALRDKNLLDFYKSLNSSDIVNFKDNALLHASMFGSTYRCEQTFSQMKLNKNSTRILN